MARFGTRGFVDGMLNGAVIGLPPIWNYGSPELQGKIVPEVGNQPVPLNPHFAEKKKTLDRCCLERSILHLRSQRRLLEAM